MHVQSRVSYCLLSDHQHYRKPVSEFSGTGVDQVFVSTGLLHCNCLTWDIDSMRVYTCADNFQEEPHPTLIFGAHNTDKCYYQNSTTRHSGLLGWGDSSFSRKNDSSAILIITQLSWRKYLCEYLFLMLNWIMLGFGLVVRQNKFPGALRNWGKIIKR